MEENILLDDDLLELEGIDYARENMWFKYKDSNNNPVPRVSHIIGYNRNQDYLVNWAANIGMRKYNYYRDKALGVGTIVHQFIDDYLVDKYINKNNNFKPCFDEIEVDYRENAYNCLENFKLWEKNLNDHGYFIEKIIAIEVSIYCPWYGGTVDAIVVINGAVYLVDFKTSKQISPEYLIQASSYMWIINNGYAKDVLGDLKIDGIGIIRVEKRNIGKFNELFLNNFIPEQHILISNYQNCFAAYVNSYYRTISTDYITEKYINYYNQSKVFNVKGE